MQIDFCKIKVEMDCSANRRTAASDAEKARRRSTIPMRTADERLGAARAAVERAKATMEANLMAPRSLLEKQFVESTSGDAFCRRLRFGNTDREEAQLWQETRDRIAHLRAAGAGTSTATMGTAAGAGTSTAMGTSRAAPKAKAKTSSRTSSRPGEDHDHPPLLRFRPPRWQQSLFPKARKTGSGNADRPVGGEGEDGVAPSDQYEALFGKTGSEFEEDRNRPHPCGQWRRLHPENPEYEYGGSKVKLVNGRRASLRWGQDHQRQSRKNGFLCFPSGRSGSRRGFSALPLGEIESTTEESSASEWHYEDEEDGEFEEAEITGLDDIDVELEDREDGTTTTKNEMADCAFSTCIAKPVLSESDPRTRTAAAPEQREDPNLSESSLDEITGKRNSLPRSPPSSVPSTSPSRQRPVAKMKKRTASKPGVGPRYRSTSGDVFKTEGCTTSISNSDKDNSVHRLDPGSVSAVVSQLLRGVVRGLSSSAASSTASTRGSSGPPTTPLAVALSQTGVQSGVALEVADSLENLFASEQERLRRELKTSREKWERRVDARERNRSREQPPATGETDAHAKDVEAAGARLAAGAGRKHGEGAGSPPV